MCVGVLYVCVLYVCVCERELAECDYGCACVCMCVGVLYVCVCVSKSDPSDCTVILSLIDFTWYI